MKCRTQVGIWALFAAVFAAGGAFAQDGAGGAPGNSAPPAAPPASAPGASPCDNDIVALCPNAKTGMDRMQCIKDNKEKLSAACKARLAESKKQRKGAWAGYEGVCKDDIAKHCADVKGPKIGCLIKNQDSLSEACGKAVAKVKKWRAKPHHKKGSKPSSAPAPAPAPQGGSASGQPQGGQSPQ